MEYMMKHSIGWSDQWSKGRVDNKSIKGPPFPLCNNKKWRDRWAEWAVPCAGGKVTWPRRDCDLWTTHAIATSTRNTRKNYCKLRSSYKDLMTSDHYKFGFISYTKSCYSCTCTTHYSVFIWHLSDEWNSFFGPYSDYLITNH